jgi:L-2-hydroxyglutarate oxidase LhgO
MYIRQMEKADIVIIGAGVIGLAVAAEVAKPGLNVYILEKDQAHGGGISSRNSEVIHGGMYYPEGSLKATLCVTGRHLLYEIAAKYSLPHRKTGKLIIATTNDETEEIERLHENAKNNSMSSTELITARRVAQLEPNIRARAALYSPQTGIISAHALMNHFLLQAQEKGAVLVNHTKVVRIDEENQGYKILTQSTGGEAFEFSCAAVVNAAGLESDTIAKMAGGNYLLHYCKGDYCSISGVKRGIVRRLIYPVPEKDQTGLGIHLTIDLDGRLKLGPDATYIPREENYQVTAEKASLFYRSAGKFLPFLQEENVSPDMAGIRPKLQGPEGTFRDFVIKEDLPGFINLVGIESPGLTASPAIARLVKKMLTKTI